MLVGWIAKSSSAKVASVRYRCLAPIDALVERGVAVETFKSINSKRYSLVIFSKSYTPKNRELALELKAQGIRTALDLCDNHFYNPNNLPSYTEAGRNLTEMLSIVDCCICSSSTLKQEVAERAGPTLPIFVVGDAVETLPPLARPWWPLRQKTGRAVLLWQGIHGVPNAECGMTDILRVGEILSKLAQRYDFELVVLSNSKEKYKQAIAPLPFRTRYVEWNLKRLRNLLDVASAVLIPVTPNPFTHCKTNNRLALALQYGVPVVADSIPSYAEFAPYVFLNRWEEGLTAILERSPIVTEMTRNGSTYVADTYSLARIAEEWERVLTAAHQCEHPLIIQE